MSVVYPRFAERAAIANGLLAELTLKLRGAPLKAAGLFYTAVGPSARYVAWQKGVDHLERSVGKRLDDLRARCPLPPHP